MSDTSPFGDISRETLDRSDAVAYTTLAEKGISESVVRKIAESNNEPKWMLDFRLKSLEIFTQKSMPTW